MWNGSEFELEKLGILLKDSEETKSFVVKCVGSLEEEMETKVVTKSCRGVISKERVKGTGRGTLKVSAHITAELYSKLHGMESDELVETVVGYGRNSVHPNFCLTAYVKDEDGEAKYKAYPNCVVKTGLTRKIENGAEEVAELELEIGVSPDENGFGVYEMPEATTNAEIQTSWLENFTADLVLKDKTA